MKLSDNTSISMPARNLLSILGATALGVWAYFGIIERLNNIETRATLFEADLLKAADQKPIDQEQYMLLEFSAKQLEKVTTEMESMMNNRVNIDFLKNQVSKLQKDVEELKDKVRANGIDD
jgi:small-conductance mechanosensitive channel|tara:strand:+ start:51 stop:413 length:363 start_codon:yes stop_codon:yes gene_type:complete